MDRAGTDISSECLASALRLLSYRPRSERELKSRLERRFASETIEIVIAKLKEMRMVDDAAFAEFWCSQRESFSPRSKRMVQNELRRKGVDPELAADVTGKIDDENNAYRAAYRKAGMLVKEGHEVFKRRLSYFLNRRGFGYEVTSRTVKRLWSDLN